MQQDSLFFEYKEKPSIIAYQRDRADYFSYFRLIFLDWQNII